MLPGPEEPSAVAPGSFARFGEGHTALSMPGGRAADLLPAADGDIDIQRVELDHASDAPGALGREDGRAAPGEPVEDEPIAPATAS